MQAALKSAGLSDEDRFHLDFALGKAMHDVGRTDDAFAHYSKANALRLKSQPYRSEEITRTVDRCIDGFTAEAFAERRGGCDAPDPIFIVGMPRAGSTLVEQILSSHSLVEGTSELPDLPMIAREGRRIPRRGAHARSRSERRARGEEYLKRAGVQRRTVRPFFIDKLPNNWLFVPLHPTGPAEREDHRCAPPSARLLLLELPPAFRQGSGVHLRSRATSVATTRTMCG